MTVATTISPVLGVVSTNDPSGTATGVSINQDVNNSGFSPYVLPVTALSTGSTLVAGNAGVLTIAGGSASQIVMPAVATCAGSMFVFRTATNKAHFLTGSASDAGVTVFTDGNSQGSKLTLANVVGSSVALVSDGAHFLVIGNSGSLAFAGA
jgi:hypothetical protein